MMHHKVAPDLLNSKNKIVFIGAPRHSKKLLMMFKDIVNITEKKTICKSVDYFSGCTAGKCMEIPAK